MFHFLLGCQHFKKVQLNIFLHKNKYQTVNSQHLLNLWIQCICFSRVPCMINVAFQWYFYNFTGSMLLAATIKYSTFLPTVNSKTSTNSLSPCWRFHIWTHCHWGIFSCGCGRYSMILKEINSLFILCSYMSAMFFGVVLSWMKYVINVSLLFHRDQLIFKR